MKVKHDRKPGFDQAKKVRIKTENWIFDLSECKAIIMKEIKKEIYT